MQTRALWILLVALVMVGQVVGQPGDTIWATGFERGHTTCADAVPLSDGNYLMVGYAPPQNIEYLKISPDGDLLNAVRFPYEGWYQTAALCAIPMPEGGAMIGGYRYGNSAVNKFELIVRIDENTDTLWTKSFIESNSHKVQKLIYAGNGNTLLISFWEGMGATIRLVDSTGAELWSKDPLLVRSDMITDGLMCSDGSFLVVGYRADGQRYPNHYRSMILHLSSEGDSLWGANRGVQGTEYTSIYKVRDGYLALGQTNVRTRAMVDFLDSDFLLVRSREYGREGVNKLIDVEQLEDGYLLFGATDQMGYGRQDYWMMRVDEDGDSLWSTFYGGEGTDFMAEVERTPDNDYLLFGTRGVPVNSADELGFWAVRIDSLEATIAPSEFNLLQPETDAVFSSPGIDLIWEAGDDANLYDSLLYRPVVYLDSLLTDSLELPIQQDTTYHIAMLRNGRAWWTVYAYDAYGQSTRASEVRSFSLNSDLILTPLSPQNGDTISTRFFDLRWEPLQNIDPGDSVFYMTRLSGEGIEYSHWIRTSSDSLHTTGAYPFRWNWWLCGVTDLFGDTIVSDTTWFYFNYYAYTPAQENVDLLPTETALLPNHPNPFNPATEIEYSIARAGDVSLKVYDVLGREVANLVEGVKSAGNYAVQFDGANLPSGVYIYRLQAGDFTQSRKMVLMK